MRFLRLRVSVVVCLVLVFAFTLRAQDYSLQTGSPTFSTAHPVPLGFLNLANGNLHQQISFGFFPQRGGRPFAFGMVYDSRIWSSASGSWLANNAASGWRFSTSVDPGSAGPTSSGNLGCWQGGIIGGTWHNSATTRSNFTWTAPDGTTHLFNIATIQPIPGNPCSPPPDIPNGSAHATDSSGFLMVVSNYSSASVFAPDGAQVYPNYEDSNGNFFTPGSWGSETDTLGRTPVTVTTNCNGNSHQTCYNVLNPQGGQSIYTVTTTSVTVSTAFGQSGVNEFSGSLTVVQSIALPNTKSYQFGYDSYGELNSITLPTGGTITYGYTNYQDSIGNKNRWVTSRTSGGGTWSYTPQVISSCSVGCQQQVTVNKPSGDNTVYTFTLNNGAWSNQVQAYTGAVSPSNLLATRSTTWNFSNPCQTQGCTGNQYIQMSQDTVTWTGGSTPSQTKQYTYDSTNDTNITSFKEWKFYTGSLPSTPDRETDFVYLNTSAYTSKNILDRVATITLKDNTGTVKFRQDTAYDQGSFTGSNCITGASQHDDTKYGCSSTTRGNPTSITVYTDPVTPGGGIATSLGYDSLGNLRSSTDPLNHATSFAYTDSWSTSSCGPPSSTYAYATTATNALSQSTNSTYDPCTGLLASDKDLNSQTTSISYDSMLRMTQEAFPDGGQASWTYNDTANPPTMVTTQKLNSSQNLTSTAVLDGLGRVSQTQLTSDTDGTDYVDITHDANGRVSQQSNPHRSGSSPSDGTTTYTFDGLDRITKVTRPDTSTVQTAFSGNTETVTDEAGKKRQYQFDGLGNLSQVTEDPGGLGYVTTYTTDVFGNITNVTQNGGRQRSFVYDALSRLTSETNPESGTTTYSYYANGNLYSKLDARGIATAYGYDALNRLVQKTYSDSTPGAFFAYDQVTYPGYQTNVIGRLTSEGTWDGTCWQTGIYFGYDQMGRSNFELHALFEGDTTGCPYVQTYFTVSYDLAGNQTSLTYPSGRVVKSQVNGANRLTKIYVDDFNSYNYLSSANYSPFGAPTNFAMGNSVTETTTYNNRFQTSNQQVRNTASTLLNHTYGFGASGQNNGNVMNITDNLNSSLTQNFSYDSLNRLGTAQTSGTSGANCWGQQYGYDAWGNLLTETPNVSGCPTNSLNVGVNTNNQITNTGFVYDAAGNMTNDGTNGYVYDAESRATSLNSGAATYTYDAEGRRMAKKIGSANTWYIHFNGNAIAEYSIGDEVWNDYIFVGGRRLAAASTDDIFNPGFEQGMEGWRTWQGDSSGTEQVITDSTRAHSGNNYLQLSTTTAQVWTMNQGVAVNPGDQLTFGGWVYLESGSATGGLVGWNIVVLDANGNTLANDGAANVTAGAWTYQSVNYTVPSGGASVFLYAQIYAPTGLTTARFDDAFLTGASGQGVHYYHSDHLGSARLMTDASGSQSWSATYLPFGQEWNPQSTTNHYKFTGFERDSESGLDNALLRKYSSQLGRWMTPDPAGLAAVDPTNPQSWNRYAYVLNNPLKFIDPTGLQCVWDDGSYDSIDDPVTGSQAGCEGQGGTWIDPSFFSDFGIGDWTDQAQGWLATIVFDIQNGWALEQTGSGVGGWMLVANGGAGPIDWSLLGPAPTTVSPAYALGRAINATGVQALTSPCTPAAFYLASASAAVSFGASATGAEGEAVFPEIKGAADALKASKAGQAMAKAGPWIAAGSAAAKFAGVFDRAQQKVSNGVQQVCTALE